MRERFHLPSPAMVLATIALFVALTGTVVAAGIVAKAKFALNAGKVESQALIESWFGKSEARGVEPFAVTE
jgi:hypothetical protein